MDKFISWYRNNYTEITWFIIGFLVMGGLHDLQRGNLTGALLSFGLAGVNIWLDRR